MILEKGPLGVRELKPSDEPYLLKWMSDPEVLAFYEGRDRPHDLAMVRDNFFRKEEWVTPCLILFREEPIGYIQFYLLPDQEATDYGYTDPKGIYGMDQFIGEPQYWNQGIGTKLVSAMAQYLCSSKGAKKVVMDPETWNHRAIRCYEKSGFRIVEKLPKHELHEGEWRDCWLMEYVPSGNEIVEGETTLRELQEYIKSKDHHPERKHGYFQKLIEEVGELSEAIRKNKRMNDDGEIKGTLEEELYDVLYYVAALANVYEVDLERCFRLKEKINDQKYSSI